MNQTSHQSHHSLLIAGALYLVPTPIGNLKDITMRALETLEQVDAIICEDTRVTHKLLSHYKIKKPLYVYNDHSQTTDKDKIITMLHAGKSLALVSDAGTPLLSDPGYKLVQAVIDDNLTLVSLPGASAITTALPLSGLPTDQFCFVGFLPPKSQKRCTALKYYEAIPASLVFFESPRRIKDTLKDIQGLFPLRRCVLMRELTKKFEETLRGTAGELLEVLQEKDIKGELVGVIEPASHENTAETEEEMIDLLKASLQNMSLKDAVSHVNGVSSFTKKEIYRHALALTKEGS